MTHGPALVIDEAPSPEDIGVLGRGLAQFNAAFVPAPVRKTFALFLRASDGRILGGAEVQHIWRTIYIHRFWVDAALRGQGEGRRLMQALEEAARERGVQMLWLETMNWQARGFYEKQGFTAFAELAHPAPGEGWPAPVSIFMTKQL